MINPDDMKKASASELIPGCAFYIQNGDSTFSLVRMPSEAVIQQMKRLAKWQEKDKMHVTDFEMFKRWIAKHSRSRTLFLRKSKPFKTFDE